jgi:hypothetical protein
LIEFKPWPKTPRLNGASMVITEKIDGTNAAVIVSPDGEVGAQSRNRLITPVGDNYGFAKWVWEYADELREILGPGHHYGEWWGSGIQRGYGLRNGDKRFSLFNTARWGYKIWEHWNEDFYVPGLETVPVLYEGEFDTAAIHHELEMLRLAGSYLTRARWDSPEGLVVYIPRLDKSFKVLLENDDVPKGAVKTA